MTEPKVVPNKIPAVCSYCGVGCNLEFTLDEKGKPNVNILMSTVPFDPIARMPSLKAIPAAVEKLA